MQSFPIPSLAGINLVTVSDTGEWRSNLSSLVRKAFASGAGANIIYFFFAFRT